MTTRKPATLTTSPDADAPLSLWRRFTSWLARWQEYVGWAPLAIFFTLLGFVVLGALDRNAATDTLPVLGMLPIKLLYAVIACGVVFLVRRRWRRKLNRAEQDDLWQGLRAGETGAVLIYFGDLVFTLAALAMLLYFFRLPA